MSRLAKKGRPRVLHCPTECGNHGPMLAKYERKLGLDSWSMSIGKTYLNFRADEREPGSIWKRELFRWKMFRRALKSDVIFYNAGSSIAPTPNYQLNPTWVHTQLQKKQAPSATGNLPAGAIYPPIYYLIYSFYAMFFSMIDVWILKKMGKKIFVIFQGGDARLEVAEVFDYDLPWYDKWANLLKWIRLKLWARWADRIYYRNPDLAWHLPERAEWLPYIIIDPKEYPNIPPRLYGLLRFGHIVNHMHFKGSWWIIKAFHNLKRKGYKFEFEFHANIPREKALEMYERIDVLVEQVKYFYGCQAVECMAMSKPVVTHIRPKDKIFLPLELLNDFPAIDATPETIENVLENILNMPRTELRKLGNRSRLFVQRWHDPMKITRKIVGDYENSARTE